MRIVALDVGDKKIGVAVTDPTGLISQPYSSLRRNSNIIAKLANIIEELQAELIVIGLPYLADGSPGEQVKKTKDFARELKRNLRIPVVFFDERLTTREAQSVIRECVEKRSSRKQKVDSIAASLILKGYLESKKGAET